MKRSDKVVAGSLDAVEAFTEELSTAVQALPSRIDVNSENVEHGLTKLVLTVVELIRKLMEKQAIRRVEGGSLTDEEIERLGESLFRLEEKMDELKVFFGLEDEDLSLDLGPLGRLL